MATDESGTFQQPDRKLLDQKAKAFAVDLVERWIFDPSNVRLLRISFDLFPSAEHLKIVLGLLEELVIERGESEAYDSVVLTAKYVASELLRAGATETGFVRDDDELPVRASVVTFREHLANFAVRILSSTTTWYLRDQAVLYLAVIGSPIPDETASELPEKLRFLVDCLSGDVRESGEGLTQVESIAIAMIASRIARDHETAISVLQELVNSDSEDADASGRLSSILLNDHELASEVLDPVALGEVEADSVSVSSEETSLSTLVAEHGSVFPDEVLALRLLSALLDVWPEYTLKQRRAVCPNQILLPDLDLNALQRSPHVADLRVVVDHDRRADDRRYAVPSWMNQSDRWRLQIGLILRCAILGHPDATSSSRRSPLIDGVSRYRGVRSGVFRRQHGLYSGRSGLGDDFIALSPWFSELLSRLTAWPGTSSRNDHVNIGDSLTLKGLKSIVRARLKVLRPLYAANSRVQIYPFPIRLRRKPPEGPNEALDLTSAQSFRVALVQTTLPTR